MWRRSHEQCHEGCFFEWRRNYYFQINQSNEPIEFLTMYQSTIQRTSQFLFTFSSVMHSRITYPNSDSGGLVGQTGQDKRKYWVSRIETSQDYRLHYELSNRNQFSISSSFFLVVLHFLLHFSLSPFSSIINIPAE